MIPELSIHFPAMACFDNHDSQNSLLYAGDDAGVVYPDTVQNVAVLELFHSRRQWIVRQPENAGIQTFQQQFQSDDLPNRASIHSTVCRGRSSLSRYGIRNLTVKMVS